MSSDRNKLRQVSLAWHYAVRVGQADEWVNLTSDGIHYLGSLEKQVRCLVAAARRDAVIVGRGEADIFWELIPTMQAVWANAVQHFEQLFLSF